MFVVVTGASRGIGLELVRAGLDRGYTVLAVARSPEASEELQELKEKSEKLRILKLDLLSNDAIIKLRDSIKDWPLLDILINNAGVSLGDESLEDFEKTFVTNTFKPFFMTKGLFEKLRKSKRPVSVQITSQMGSLENNTSGGYYSYRSSKAALNMLFKSLSIDEDWLISLLVHPGWVKTRMGGSSAPTSPKESAEGIWKLIDNADKSSNGSFVDFRGETLPW